MDIKSLGILSSSATQGNINTIVDKANSSSFSRIFSEVRETDQISAKTMFSSAFPVYDVSVKVGNCNIASDIWERKDFPVWQYFQDNVSADSLNNWKQTGAEPTGAEPYIQQELSKISFGKIVVMLPESLQQKMEADPEYAQEIADKLQKWKVEYDRTDNALAASYGYDPIENQMSKRYCIQLDEDGNVKNYTVIGGGIGTKKSDDTNKTHNEVPHKTVVKTVQQKNSQREIVNGIAGWAEEDYTNIAPNLVTFYKKR